MRRKVCEEKGGKVPEAKLRRCIRSREKELLDKCDGLVTAAGNETRPKYYIQYIHPTLNETRGISSAENETRGISSAENCPLRTAEVGLGVVA